MEKRKLTYCRQETGILPQVDILRLLIDMSCPLTGRNLPAALPNFNSLEYSLPCSTKLTVESARIDLLLWPLTVTWYWIFPWRKFSILILLWGRQRCGKMVLR